MKRLASQSPLICILLLLGFASALCAAEETASQTLVWPDGTRYVGGVVDGKRSGHGTIFWPDGTRYVGSFSNDMREGAGTMVLPDGRVFNGIFKNDSLVGTATPVEPGTSSGAAEVGSNVTAEPAAPDTQVAQAPRHNDARRSQAPRSTKPAPPTRGITDEIKAELSGVIDAWASAWSAQDVRAYLSAYGSGFDVPGKLTRRAWEGLRRSRLTRPRSIELKLGYEKFEMLPDGTAEVWFRQSYRSNLYSDVTAKVLVLQREDGGWRIIRENSR